MKSKSIIIVVVLLVFAIAMVWKLVANKKEIEKLNTVDYSKTRQRS